MSVLSGDVAALDPKKRALLERLLRQKGVDVSRLPITPRDRDHDPVPPSLAQERLWILERLQPEAAIYNEPFLAQIDGALRPETLSAAITEVTRRHESLRTRFPERDGLPMQVVEPPANVPLPVVDLSGLADPEARRREARSLVRRESMRPFDLARGPLLRTLLLELSETEHHFLVNLSHLVCDGSSIGVLVDELERLYAAYLGGRSAPLPELPVQYADYSQWQRQWLVGAALDRLLEHWTSRLEGFPTLLELPTDHPRPAARNGRGGQRRFGLPATLSQGLRALAKDAGTTLFNTLLAAFFVLLERTTGQQRILIGTPFGGRRRAELEGLIGFFVNTLVLDADLGEDPPFEDFLVQVHRTTLAAHKHSELPFSRLVEAIHPERDAGHTALVQVMFLVQKGLRHAPPAAGERPLRLGLERVETPTAKLDLGLLVDDLGSRLGGEIEFDADLFDESTIDRLRSHFLILLEGIVAAPHSRLSRLPLLAAAERRQVLGEWQGRRDEQGRELLAHQLFETRARRRPEAPALVYEDRELSYGELNRLAGGWARALRALGVGPEVPVGLLAEHTPEAVVGLLAILEAGGFYVPLDPALPERRLAYTLADTGARVVLSSRPGWQPPEAFGGTLLVLDGEPPETDALPDRPESPANLAYVIYTSGSTGMPKAAMITHRGLVNLALASRELYDLGPGDRMLMVPPLVLDASAGTLFSLLANGAAVVLHPRPAELSGRELRRLAERSGLNAAQAPTALLHQWVDDLDSDEPGATRSFPLDQIVVGGEAIAVDKLPGWRRLAAGRGRLHNQYGPTETTVCATSYTLAAVPDPGDLTSGVPIGRPLPNVEIHLLDRRLRPVPAGVTGEVFIGGAGLARGYLGAPRRTARRYLPHPFADGERLYRTGDQARWLGDGNLRFLGRFDDQVKIRGYRIEPGEVETVLVAHPEVGRAAVLAREDVPGIKRLVAYVVAAGDQAPSPVALRKYLRERLPDPMLPAAFVTLEALPLNVNGKIDRGRLPAPSPDRPDLETAYREPRDELEQRIAAVWGELLGLEKLGAMDNFFDLGGHSLLLIRAQSRLEEALAREISTIDLFQYPTVRSLAEFLTRGEARPEPAPAAMTAASEPGASPSAASEPAADGTQEPLAIIGMSGRFPGAANVDELWHNLAGGVESITWFSDEELLAAGIEPEILEDPSFVRARGALGDGIEDFDAAFFGVSPREAQAMDPQHRLFLETAWHALEDAGYDPETYPGRIGVFGGVGANAYNLRHVHSNPEVVRSLGPVQAAIGSEKDFITTRVSYKLNLRGPSYNVQTACSTSLVAFHLACRSLLDGESDMAMAGGVTIDVPQAAGYFYQEGGIFSPDGHCRAFDFEGMGTVPASGVGIVVVKRLRDALADGDTIRAVVKGSAINNDGNVKVGFTAPSVRGQVDVLRRAQERAGVHPESITYIETHGTATRMGDLIECTALKDTFAPHTEREGFCALGSIKSNFGHLDTAAGVAGLIKTALALEHRQIPPSLHFRRQNEKIFITHSPFFVNTELRDWPANGTPRRAGVSSFGIGGTNAHVILEEAPEPSPTSPSRAAQLLTLSARTPVALDAATHGIAEHLKQHPELDLADVAYTLHLGRRAFGFRRTLVAGQDGSAVTADGWLSSSKIPDGERRTAFMFPGGGAQYPGMGFELYRGEPVFRQVIDRCAEIQASAAGQDLLQILYPPETDSPDVAERMERTSIALPALLATEVALARLWISWGVQPAAMIGHSLGEYAAAHLAGVMSLEDALALVTLRGRLFETLPPGNMLSVSLPESELRSRMDPELSIAAINVSSMSVASGPTARIAELEVELSAEGIDCRRIPIAVAAHSRMIDRILEEFRRFVAGLRLEAPQIPFLSNVTGTWITEDEATSPAYWADHLRRTVRFASGVGELLKESETVLLEVGPGQTLSRLSRGHEDRQSAHEMVASMRRAGDEAGDLDALLEALGALWRAGVAIDWPSFHGEETRRRVPLPPYPFERQRYWLEPGAGLGAGRSLHKAADVADWLYAASWRRRLAPPLASETLAGEPRHWLVLGHAGGLTARLVERLTVLGQTVSLVTPGETFEASEDGVYTLDPRRAEHYRQLIVACGQQELKPRRVVHLWGMAPEAGDAPLPPDAVPADAADFERSQTRGFYSLLMLAGALGQLENLPPGLRLAAVASEVYDVTGTERLQVAPATLLGACEGLSGKIVCQGFDLALDTAEAAEAWAAERLIAELSTEAAGGVVAYRGDRRWVRGFEPEPVADPAMEAFEIGGVYLITGGVTSLGLDLAGALARVGRIRLALAGIVDLPPQDQWPAWLKEHDESHETSAKIRDFQALEALGAEILVISEDFTTPDGMRAIVERTRRHWGALDGVVHAGGATEMSALEEQGPEDCERHFRPIVHTLLALAEVLGNTPLDVVLLASSLPAVLGDAPSVAYRSAHAFMAAFAAERTRSTGRRWQSVLWDDGGGRQKRGPKAGGLATEDGTEALRRLSSLEPGAEVAVSPVELGARIDGWRQSRAAGGDGEADDAAQRMLHPRPALETPYVAPRDEYEEKLATIWQELLGIDQVGVDDNFMELGGDSVMGLQVVVKARREDIVLTQRAMFLNPTVAGLARAAQTTPGLHAEQGLVRGAVTLSPIQRWFLERDLIAPHHWNLPNLLEVEAGIDRSFLERSAENLLRHHDALRLRLLDGDHGWHQICAEPDDRSATTRVDLSRLSGEAQRRARVAATAQMQTSLDLTHGPLARFGLFLRGDGEPDHLFLLVHHMVADAISLPILFEDLETGVRQLSRGEAISLPLKTTSYEHWSARMTEQRTREDREAEQSYWLAPERREVPPLPFDHDLGPNIEAAARGLSFQLDEDDTRQLQRHAPQVSGVDVNAVLLSALALAYRDWSGHEKLLVEFEGHGRDPLFDEVDLTRTVGWFTSAYPMLVDLHGVGSEVEALLPAVHEQLNAIPHNGIGYSILRYLGGFPETAEKLRQMPQTQISFLYLGQEKAADSGTESLFRPLAEPTGPAGDRRQARTHALEVAVRTVDGRLAIGFVYSRNLHRRESIEAFGRGFIEALRSIAASSRAAEAMA